MYMSHLPVRDVHLLVVTLWKRKNHHISSCKDPISTGLHHLGEGLMVLMENKQGKWLHHSGCRLYEIPCWQWWNLWSPCGHRSVSGNLWQERFLQEWRHSQQERSLYCLLWSHVTANNETTQKRSHQSFPCLIRSSYLYIIDQNLDRSITTSAW